MIELKDKFKHQELNYPDELLEELWLDYEKKGKKLEVGVELEDRISEDDLKLLSDSGYIEEKNGKYVLTGKGYLRSKMLIRSHRLAERLLADVMNLEEEMLEEAACKYEHMLDEDALDSVCILLGHPRSCPHGNPIPEGECCTEQEMSLRPLVVPLKDLRPGEEATVEYIGTRDNSRLSYLTSLGVMTGRPIKLIKKRPSYLVKVEETTLAFDHSIAEEIFVKPKSRKVEKKKRRGFGFGKRFGFGKGRRKGRGKEKK